MAQTYEYPLWTPHKRAKVYKRYTGEVPIELKDNESITIEDVRYVLYASIKWIESAAGEDGDNQPLEGLVVETSYLTIRTNSLKKFKKGDLVILPKDSQWAGLWIISDGVRSDTVYAPKAMQTYQYLPLEKMH